MAEAFTEWFASWSQTITLADALIVVAVIVGAVIFAKKGWPAVKRFAAALFGFVKIVDSVAGLPAFIERTDSTLAAQDTKIAEIHHEVNYNNGSSVKDAVSRVEAGVQGIYPRLEGLDAAVSELRDADEDLAAQIDEHAQPKPPKE